MSPFIDQYVNAIRYLDKSAIPPWDPPAWKVIVATIDRHPDPFTYQEIKDAANKIQKSITILRASVIRCILFGVDKGFLYSDGDAFRKSSPTRISGGTVEGGQARLRDGNCRGHEGEPNGPDDHFQY